MGALGTHPAVANAATQPNLRQVHLIHAELHDELRAASFAVSAGQMGENVTTRGVEVTGLRNPCKQLDGLLPGLMEAVLDRDEKGILVRKAGIMAVVVTGGEVRPGDGVRVEPPAGPHRPLEKV